MRLAPRARSRPRVWTLWSRLGVGPRDLRGPLEAGAALALAFVVMTVAYAATNRLAALRGRAGWAPNQLTLLADGRRLDEVIPFVPASILVYQGLAPFLCLAALCAPRTRSGGRQLLLLLQGQLIATAGACGVFLLFPARILARHEAEQALVSGSLGVWSGLYGSLHRSDAPYNAWPSLHVALPVLAGAVLTRWLRRRTWCVVLVWTAVASLALSTLTTRQHDLIDVVTGATWGGLVWCWCLRPALPGPIPRHRQDRIAGTLVSSETVGLEPGGESP